MNPKLRRILPNVQKPARYVGGEFGQILKDKKNIRTRVAFCFPDTYEIGMSNLGLHILYQELNAREHVWCERLFSPWGDMEDALRASKIPLYALESGDPLSEFDVLAFSLGYELCYTTVLNMLDLAGLPLFAKDRDESMPLVIAGGTACYNPEPMADFIDLFAIGEGEEIAVSIVTLYESCKNEGLSRQAFLEKAAQMPGVYVPSLYEVSHHTDGKIAAITPKPGAPATVQKRILENLNAHPQKPSIIPSTEIVHDRTILEVFRGCMRGCRFCQAGYVYRPMREKSIPQLQSSAETMLTHSGYQEMSLSSLSTSDFSELPTLCDGLLDFCTPQKINLSLPSLRADNFSIELAQKIQKVRKSSLTFAPEAGSERLRRVINKNVTEEALLTSLQAAFAGGYSAIKLYFMLGLPTETDEDVLEITRLVSKVHYRWKQHATNKNRGFRLTISTSLFVPKAHTAFQWEGQISREEYLRRVTLLRENLPNKAVSYNWHEAESGYVEAILSRGDRRLSAVIHAAFQSGAKLDSWGEYFSATRWADAFSACGIDPDFYALGRYEKDDILPWQHIETGVTTDFLWSEYENAQKAASSPNCREACLSCGVQDVFSGGICHA